jgi:hypothetical protein
MDSHVNTQIGALGEQKFIRSCVVCFVVYDALRVGLLADERGSEAKVLSTQLVTGLCLLQGVVLNHSSSKSYLGQKHALEVCCSIVLDGISDFENAGDD